MCSLASIRCAAIAGALLLVLGCAGTGTESRAQRGSLVPACVDKVYLGMSADDLERGRPNAVRGGKTWPRLYETGLVCRFFDRADYIFDRQFLFWGEEHLTRVLLTKHFPGPEEVGSSREAFLSTAAEAWGREPGRFVRWQGLRRERHYLPVLEWEMSAGTVEAIYTPSRELDGRPFTLEDDPPPKQPLFYFELRITSPAYWGLTFFLHPKPAASVKGAAALFQDFDAIVRAGASAPEEPAF